MHKQRTHTHMHGQICRYAHTQIYIYIYIYIYMLIYLSSYVFRINSEWFLFFMNVRIHIRAYRYMGLHIVLLHRSAHQCRVP